MLLGANSATLSSKLTRPVSDALSYLNDRYAVIYGYDATDFNDPWQLYSVVVPPFVNDLQEMNYGKGYWIDVDRKSVV